jgi:hypothetical protein
MAFRREILQDVGFLDEKYRFYRHLDLDLSLAARTQGFRVVIDTDLPVVRHEHIDWSQTPPEERDRLSKRNFYRFLRKWGARTDLLVARARCCCPRGSVRQRGANPALLPAHGGAHSRDSGLESLAPGCPARWWRSILTPQRNASAAHERPAPKRLARCCRPYRCGRRQAPRKVRSE